MKLEEAMKRAIIMSLVILGLSAVEGCTAVGATETPPVRPSRGDPPLPNRTETETDRPHLICDLCWSADNFTNDNPGIYRLRFTSAADARPERICVQGQGPLSVALAHVNGPGSRAILGRASSEGDEVCLVYDDFVFEPTLLQVDFTYEITVITDYPPDVAVMSLDTPSICAGALRPLDAGGGQVCPVDD
jgi:hypothetical protein